MAHRIKLIPKRWENRSIQRFDLGGKPGQDKEKNPGVLESLWLGIKGVANAVGDWIEGVVRAIFIGPNGEIIPNPDPNPDHNVVPTPPSGYRPASQEEAIAVLNYFADKIEPWYDSAAGTYIGPASAERSIRLYEHMPADTIITVYPLGGTYGRLPQTFTNKSYDLGRRGFDYYNSKFPNNAPVRSTSGARASRNSSTNSKNAQPQPTTTRPDTIRVEVVNGQPMLVSN